MIKNNVFWWLMWMMLWCDLYFFKKLKLSLFFGFDFFNVEKWKGKFFIWFFVCMGVIESNFYVVMELLIMI